MSCSKVVPLTSFASKPPRITSEHSVHVRSGSARTLCPLGYRLGPLASARHSGAYELNDHHPQHTNAWGDNLADLPGTTGEQAVATRRSLFESSLLPVLRIQVPLEMERFGRLVAEHQPMRMHSWSSGISNCSVRALWLLHCAFSCVMLHLL